MTEATDSQMLVMASAQEYLAAGRVWGTGGWLPPEQREALDWFTLGRLLGWRCDLAGLETSRLHSVTRNMHRWVVLACDPGEISDDIAAGLGSLLLSQPVMVILRAGAPGTPASRLGQAICGTDSIAGRSLRWIHHAGGRTWSLRTSLGGCQLELKAHSEIWATLDGAPLIVARKIGRGFVVTLAFHPSLARDTDGSATALIRHLLTFGSQAPVAWLDFSNSLILRMDDPGAAQNAYLQCWSYPELDESNWASIQGELRQREARLSIAYTPGWVDDGDPARGSLTVANHRPERGPGRIHPSPLVQYQQHADGAPGKLHDYQGEYRGIQRLRAGGLGDVELHGYTHMHPDTVAWAAAADRYEEISWFRDFGPAAKDVLARMPVAQHPLTLGVGMLKKHFGIFPTTLVCPGDEWTDEVLWIALDLGFQLVDSYYLALRDGDRFCWATHVCSPYLNEPDAAWFDSGMPVVGYFHDCEPSLEGVGWIAGCLDNWQKAGANRFMDFRELASATGRHLSLSRSKHGMNLSVVSENAPELVHPLEIMIRSPNEELPESVSACVDGATMQLSVERLENNCGRVIVGQRA
jgi:hypothetical protein